MIKNITINTHSSIRIEGRQVIYFDPFKIEEERHDADAIFITHDHYDHFDPESIVKVMRDDTLLVMPRSSLRVWSESGIISSQMVQMDPGETIDLFGFLIETIPAYNILKSFHPRKKNWLGYVVTFEGRMIYVAGDTDLTPESKQVKCDIAFVPAGGKFTMNALKAAELVNIIQPEIAVPTHYGDVVGKPGDGRTFKAAVKGDIVVPLLIRHKSAAAPAEAAPAQEAPIPDAAAGTAAVMPEAAAAEAAAAEAPVAEYPEMAAEAPDSEYPEAVEEAPVDEFPEVEERVSEYPEEEAAAEPMTEEDAFEPELPAEAADAPEEEIPEEEGSFDAEITESFDEEPAEYADEAIEDFASDSMEDPAEEFTADPTEEAAPEAFEEAEATDGPEDGPAPEAEWDADAPAEEQAEAPAEEEMTEPWDPEIPDDWASEPLEEDINRNEE